MGNIGSQAPDAGKARVDVSQPVGTGNGAAHPKRSFERVDSDFAKGVALLLLLFHHLFKNQDALGWIFHGVNVTQFLADQSKVCVAMFVFLSGYGLAKRARGGIGLKKFYFDRCVKIYLTYWLIWLIFVPVGAIFFRMPVLSAFPHHPVFGVLLNLTGLQHYVYPYGGINPTWWYVSLILVLYLLFPLYYELARKFGLWFLVLSASIMFTHIHVNLLKHANVVAEYSFPLILGVTIAEKNRFTWAMDKRFTAHRWLAYAVAGAAAMFLRLHVMGLRVDGVLAAVIIFAGYEASNRLAPLKKGGAFLGRHLFNIFLFHTFLFYLYQPVHDWIYGIRPAILLYLVFLVMCLTISILLDRIKAVIRLPDVEAALKKVRFRDKIVLGAP